MAAEKPNVPAILAADVGWFGVGAHHRGIVGCRRPHSNRIATGEGEFVCAPAAGQLVNLDEDGARAVAAVTTLE